MSLRELLKVDFFQGLDSRQLQALAGNLKQVIYPAGSTIFTPGDAYSDRFYVLFLGRVELYRINLDGQRLDVGQLVPGDIFGIKGILSKYGQKNFAEATEDSIVYMATKEYFLTHLGQYPDFMMSLLRCTADAMSRIEERLLELSYNRADMTLRHFLLSHANPDTGELYNLTHEQIGNIIGTARQTVTECLGILQKQGLISVKRKSIRILDRAGLEGNAR